MLKRVVREFAEFQEMKVEGLGQLSDRIEIKMDDTKEVKWLVEFYDAPEDHSLREFQIFFPSDYPFKPPKVRPTKWQLAETDCIAMYKHAEGLHNFCMQDKYWSPSISVMKSLAGMVKLLNDASSCFDGFINRVCAEYADVGAEVRILIGCGADIQSIRDRPPEPTGYTRKHSRRLVMLLIDTNFHDSGTAKLEWGLLEWMAIPLLSLHVNPLCRLIVRLEARGMSVTVRDLRGADFGGAPYPVNQTLRCQNANVPFAEDDVRADILSNLPNLYHLTTLHVDSNACVRIRHPPQEPSASFYLPNTEVVVSIALKTLMEMGFSKTTALEALDLTGGNLENSLTILMS